MRTRRTGRVLRPGATPASSADVVGVRGVKPVWWNAVLPIAVMIAAVAIGLYADGLSTLRADDPDPDYRLWEIYGAADPFRVLVISSILGALAALAAGVGQRLLSFREGMQTLVEGARSMMPALMILALAWTLAGVTGELDAGAYLASFAQSESVTWIPLLVFLCAAFISFATGTAWGTMALLTPLSIQLVASAAGAPDPASPVMLAAVGAVLGGATVGDHISPLSDTTIMASLATGADLVDHVRTQMPYAVLVGGGAIACGYVPVALGVPVGLSLLTGIVVIGALVLFIGRRTSSDAVLTAIRLDLTSEDRSRRIGALNELSAMGGTPLSADVVRLLDDPDDQVRIQALRALGHMRHAGAQDAVERCLDSSNRHVRATAVKTLSHLGGPGVLPRILSRLQDEDPRVRANAVEAVSQMENELEPSARDALENATTDLDHRVRATAAMVLWQRTREDRHLGHLIEMVRQGSKQAALSAIYALSDVDSNFAVRLLREAVAGPDPDVQAAAARALESRETEETEKDPSSTEMA